MDLIKPRLDFLVLLLSSLHHWLQIPFSSGGGWDLRGVFSMLLFHLYLLCSSPVQISIVPLHPFLSLSVINGSCLLLGAC